jgi:2'-5' RNA ligase
MSSAKSRFTYPDTTGWQEWQTEYRFGALNIFPPAGVIEPIDELRRTHDPTSTAICQAHISLSEPLLGPLTEPQIRELQAALATVEAFEIRYGPLRTFSPYPGVAYAIEPYDNFMRLRSVVHATSIFHGSSLSRKEIAPHMTIAEFITLERSAELCRELQGNATEGTFLCSSIEYAVPTDAFSFERVLTLLLGAAPASRAIT